MLRTLASTNVVFFIPDREELWLLWQLIVPIDLGKEEIDNFSVSLGIFGFFFTEMFIEKSSMFHMTFVQIALFDWLLGPHQW